MGRNCYIYRFLFIAQKWLSAAYYIFINCFDSVVDDCSTLVAVADIVVLIKKIEKKQIVLANVIPNHIVIVQRLFVFYAGGGDDGRTNIVSSLL